MKVIALIFSLSIILLSYSCKDSIPSDSNSDNHPHPPAQIADNIPYDKLGDVGKIAFLRIGPHEDNYTAICIIDLAQKKNWTIDGANVAPQTPSISPDGQKLVYRGVAFPGSLFNWSIMTSLIDGTNSQGMINNGKEVLLPCWYFNSNEIIYIQIDGPEISIKSALLSDINNSKTLCNYNNALGYLGIPISTFQSIYGKPVLFEIGNSVYQISNFKRPELLFTIPTDENWNSIYTPRYSPDLKEIALIQEKRVLIENIYYASGGRLILYNIDTKEFKIIYEWDAQNSSSYCCGNELSLCWSPDGNKIAFCKTLGCLNSSIFIINKDGTDLTQVTNELNVNDSSISWSLE